MSVNAFVRDRVGIMSTGVVRWGMPLSNRDRFQPRVATGKGQVV